MDKWKIVIVLALAALLHSAIAEETQGTIIGIDLEGPNVCKKIDLYNVTIIVTEMIPYKDYKTVWCAKIPPRCREPVILMKQVNKTEVLQKHRAVRECCEGYKENEQQNRCIPHCQKTCGHGTCVAPNTCKCKIILL
jgi:EMI domain